MKVLILAAGYATRLYPLTKHWPKPLLLVKETPIISHTIKNIQGIKEVNEIIVVTNDKFIHHFQEWARISKFRKKIVVLSDKTTSIKNRLGAIGDISFVIKKRAIADDLLVIGGDNLFAFNLKKFVKFAKSKKDNCTVGLYDIRDPELIKHFGVVTLAKNKSIVKFQEKPKRSKSTLISMCIYYIPKANLNLVNKYLKCKHNRDAPGNYIKWLYKKSNVWGYKFNGVWHDIGDIITFYHASVTFNERGSKRNGK